MTVEKVSDEVGADAKQKLIRPNTIRYQKVARATICCVLVSHIPPACFFDTRFAGHYIFHIDLALCMYRERGLTSNFFCG